MANLNFSKAIIGGRLTADPELKTTPSGVVVTSFTVAVNRRRVKEGEEAKADFLNVTAWRGCAEFITKYFHKASNICIVGTLQTRSWVDSENVKHFATEIVADEAYFVDAKSESPMAVQQAAAMYNQGAQPSYVPDGYAAYGMPQGGAYQNQTAPKFEEISDDEELPF